MLAQDTHDSGAWTRPGRGDASMHVRDIGAFQYLSQVLYIHRLSYMAIESAFVRALPDVGSAPAGKRDHHDIFAPGEPTNTTRRFVAVHSGQAEIKENKIGFRRLLHRWQREPWRPGVSTEARKYRRRRDYRRSRELGRSASFPPAGSDFPRKRKMRIVRRVGTQPRRSAPRS